MWFYSILILPGILFFLLGIILAGKTHQKPWHFLTLIGAVLLITGISFAVKANTKANWRTEQYSVDYPITDQVTVCLAQLEYQSGYGVYDVRNGAEIGTLAKPEEMDGFFDQDINFGDYDGDGSADFSIRMTDGTVYLYCYDPTMDSQNAFAKIIIDTSRTYFPYEALPTIHLTDAQQQLYEEIYTKVLALESFSYDAQTYGYDTLNDLLVVWARMAEDHPDINNYFSIREVNDPQTGITVSLDSLYQCKWEASLSEDIAEVQAGITRFHEATEEILSNLSDDMTTYEKYYYLAKTISERTSYDYSFSHSIISTPWGGIVSDVSICQGYTEAYQYLCQQANLWCKIVSGSSRGTSHAWNLIRLAEGTYHVDITLADEQGEPGGSEWMRYFLLTQEEILEDHTITDETVATGQ